MKRIASRSAALGSLFFALSTLAVSLGEVVPAPDGQGAYLYWLRDGVLDGPDDVRAPAGTRCDLAQCQQIDGQRYCRVPLRQQVAECRDGAPQ